MVKQPGSSFIENATQVWEEIFQREETDWPSVVFLVAGYGASQFKFEHHVTPFVANLPPAWGGTLFLGDFEFSGRAGGLVSDAQHDNYLKQINAMVKSLNDPRVRWIDGPGISKEMRMYGQKHEDYITRSQHFHSPCLRRDPGKNNEAIVVCSNITEMMGQLLLGHALGPKAEFLERLKQSPKPKTAMRWCHACPKCMIPFHITPYPEMMCVDGPLVRKSENADCSVLRLSPEERSEKKKKGLENNDPLACPESCLESPVMDQFGSETDTVYVRQCLHSAALISAFRLPVQQAVLRSTRHSKCTTSYAPGPLSMGLYEDEIDWDADLFGQIGKSNDEQSASDDDGVAKAGALDDSNWDMTPTRASLNKSNNVKSMREQMKKSWGGENKKEAGKPTADWMPRFGNGPDEDEPWFTG